MSKYLQGFYKPKNPQKYRGDPTNVVYRSSWERSVMLWLDTHPACTEWGSEEVIVPYFSPVDSKMHRYFIDFVATFKKADGSVQKFLIEVKPKSQTIAPVRGKKKEKTFLTEAMTYTVNQAKWSAAEAFALERNMKFVVITEDELGIRKKK